MIHDMDDFSKEKTALSICVSMVESARVWEPNRAVLTYYLPPSWCILNGSVDYESLQSDQIGNARDREYS